jgi:hypothetical protein
MLLVPLVLMMSSLQFSLLWGVSLVAVLHPDPLSQACRLSCVGEGAHTHVRLRVCGGRYDYESVATDKADAVMAHLSEKIASFNAAKAASAAHGTRRWPVCAQCTVVCQHLCPPVHCMLTLPPLTASA